MTRKEKILVTGGTGYIGSHTVVELMVQGYEVVIIDNLSNSFTHVVDAIEQITGKRPDFVEADLCDMKRTDTFFREKKIDAIIHLAAHKAVGESVENPIMYYRNNLLSLLNLVEAALNHKVQPIVFSSSCSVYGQPGKLPVDETAPLKKAESPYANTKRIGEDILADTAKVSDLRVIALRYFNPVGAHSSALIGEKSTAKPTNLIPAITETAIGKREELLVFGNDYATPDGFCIRDYIHVTDVAKAHVMAIERLLSRTGKTIFEIFNLGTGKGHSVLEVIRMFEKTSGQKLKYRIAPRRPGDVVQVYADTTLANKELGWKTELGLEEMVASAWKWEQAIAKKKIDTSIS